MPWISQELPRRITGNVLRKCELCEPGVCRRGVNCMCPEVFLQSSAQQTECSENYNEKWPKSIGLENLDVRSCGELSPLPVPSFNPNASYVTEEEPSVANPDETSNEPPSSRSNIVAAVVPAAILGIVLLLSVLFFRCKSSGSGEITVCNLPITTICLKAGRIIEVNSSQK